MGLELDINGDSFSRLVERLEELREALENLDLTDEDQASYISELEALECQLAALEDSEQKRVSLEMIESLKSSALSEVIEDDNIDSTIMNEIHTLTQLRDKSTDRETRDHYTNLIEHLESRINPAPRITMDMDFETACKTLERMLKRGDGFIGQRKIHREQIKACADVYTAFNSDKSPLLIAQPQQGKTDVCLITIYMFLKYLVGLQKNTRSLLGKRLAYEIIYLTNIADNDLRDQNQSRAEKLHLPAWLMEHVKIIHHRGLARMHPTSAKVRLIIDDECHVALGKDKPFHDFLKRYGITYGKPRSKWKNPETLLLSVSATPYPQIVRNMLDSNAFSPVMLETSPDYYSLNHIAEDGRLRQADPVTHKTPVGYVVSDFFKERMTEFRQLCRVFGNGYMIVRSTGVRADAVKDYIRQSEGVMLPQNQRLEVRDFHCHLGNITKLNESISDAPPYPTVVIIRGTLRAGKTLSTTKHIRMWIESAGSKTDTLVQSGVGRSLGYKGEDQHGKFEDSYPIYCNAAMIDDALAFYNQFYEFDGINIVPRGNWNERVQTDEGYRQIIAQSMNEVPMAIRNSAYWGRQSKVSANNKKDLARYILEEIKPTGKAPVIVVDGPNPNHQDSWRMLLTRYPDIRGCIVYYEADKHPSVMDAAREDSLLKHD